MLPVDIYWNSISYSFYDAKISVHKHNTRRAYFPPLKRNILLHLIRNTCQALYHVDSRNQSRQNPLK